MITEDELLAEIAMNFDKCKTKHLAIVDSSVCVGSVAEVPEELLDAKKLAWVEPQEGVYIVHTHYLLHFKKSLTSLRTLLQDLVNNGYEVRSQRFKDTVPEPKFKFKDKDPVHIAVITMFSNKDIVPCYAEFLQQMTIPAGVSVDVILGDNSGRDTVKNLFDEVVAQNKDKFKDYHLIDLGLPYIIQEDEHYLAEDKHAHVATKYSDLLREPAQHYDYILKIEDDMGPPSDGLERLYAHMKSFERKKRKVACVAGYYKQKHNPELPCLSMQPEIWGKMPRMEEMQPRLIRVEMQGGGFALYSCKALHEVLPYRLVFKNAYGNFYMTGWDGFIGEEWSNTSWEQYCDGAMYCEHYF